MNSVTSRFRGYFMILISVLVVAAVWLPVMSIQADDSDDFVSDQVVVKLNLAQGATIEALNAKYSTTTLSTLLASAGIYLLQIPTGSTPAVVVDDMQEDTALVVYVEPNFIGDLPVGGSHTTWAWGGNDPAPFANQYAPDLINLPEAHAITRGTGVIVAVLDSGVQVDHPALAAVLLDGYDYVDDDTDPTDVGNGIDDDGDGIVDEGFGHGTHVAGIVHLAAPEASILPLRVLDADGRGNVFLLTEAIQYAIDHGARVINLSLGLRTDSNLLNEVIYEAAEDGVIFVAAAGNLNNSDVIYPAAYNKVIGVAALDANDVRADFSSYGDWVDIAAPGVQITSTFPISGYASWSGTSMAAPFVAGQAALLATFAQSNGEEIEDRIRSSARDIDAENPNYKDKLGKGRIDVYASMTVFGTPPPTSTPTATPIASATPTPTATPTSIPGGSLVTPGGGVISAVGSASQISVSFPSGAVSESVNVTLEAVTSLGSASTSNVVGDAWQIEARRVGGAPLTTLDADMSVTITVSPNELDALGVGDLAIGMWDVSGARWTLLPSTLDAANYRLTVQIDQLGIFAVLAGEAERIFVPLVVR